MRPLIKQRIWCLVMGLVVSISSLAEDSQKPSQNGNVPSTAKSRSTEDSPTHRIQTNAVIIEQAPKWLNRIRIDKVVKRLERELEWTVRRIQLFMHNDSESFQEAHSLGPNVRAVTIKNPKQVKVHLGPQVQNDQFDQVFGHEIVHVIAYQKYKKSIPKWLEEGLANHLAQKPPVNYEWLAKQTLPENVESLSHPLRGSRKQAQVRYKASQALAEMLSEDCDLTNLLRLSVGRKMPTYIQTYCEISDLSAAFQKWVKTKAGKDS